MDPFKERTTSGFGVSIGTDLMLESLFIPTEERYDDSREIPNKLDVNRYKYHVYNCYTLLRNIIGATKVKDKLSLYTDKRLYETLLEEVAVLDSLYDGTKCSPIIFVPEYDTVIKKMNKDKEGLNKVMVEYGFFKAGIKKYLPNYKILPSYKLDPISEDILITTAYSNDLLNVRYARKMKLLESHTGKLKTRSEWNTKYAKLGKKNMGVFPFNEKLLYLLGDSKLVGRYSIVVRKQLYEIALNKKWNSSTSYEKILNDTRDTEIFKLLTEYKTIY